MIRFFLVVAGRGRLELLSLAAAHLLCQHLVLHLVQLGNALARGASGQQVAKLQCRKKCFTKGVKKLTKTPLSTSDNNNLD